MPRHRYRRDMDKARVGQVAVIFASVRTGEDEAGYQAAAAWRDDPTHKAVRDAGRDRWYSSYTLDVALISRHYDWTKND